MNRTATARIDWDAVKEKLRLAEMMLEQSGAVDNEQLRQIFHERAVRLSARPKQLGSASNSLTVLCFKLGKETYGIELRHVGQVLTEPRISPIPGAAEPVLGLANLRGEIRTVLDLQRLLGLPGSGDSSNRYVLLLRHDERQVGLRVGRVEGVQNVITDQTFAADNVSDQASRYIQSVTPEHMGVLRIEAIFAHLSLSSPLRTQR